MDKKQVDTLDNILLSKDVVDRFYDEYKNNSEFKSELDKFLPEIQQCENQQQDNPWHKYNVLGHILHSVEAMNKLSEDEPEGVRTLLAYVMFFHDIGKPATHIRRKKQGVMIDSFFNHNVKSAEIAKEKALGLGLNEREAMVLEKLVYKHDIFMFITDKQDGNNHHRVLSKKLIADEIEDLNSVGDGQKLMRYLIMVGLADNYAQNEKMTPESIAKLKKMQNMLDEMVSEDQM